MPETGLREAAAPPPQRRALSDDDSGVSPVVGMILVLAISVVGISATVYWGLPTIDEMKANVEFRNVESQFSELDATVKELVAGTTQRTAKRWQPSISRGEIHLANETERWVFATEPYGSPGELSIGGLTDGNNTFVLKNTGGTDLSLVKVEAYRVTGSSEEQVNVSRDEAVDDQMTGTDILTWTAGDEMMFWVWRAGVNQAPQDISGNAYHFKVYAGSVLVSEMWYVETGRVTYDLAAGFGTKHVVENNGAVLTGVDGDYAIVNTPSIPPPATTGGTDRFFARTVVLNGTGEFSGMDRFDVLLSLYATYSLASYDCAKSTKSDCVVRSKIAILGDYQTPWYSYLKNTNRGYDYTPATTTFTDNPESITYLVDERPSGAAYTLLMSTINLAVN